MNFLYLFLNSSEKNIIERENRGKQKSYKKEALEIITLVRKQELHLDRDLTKTKLCNLIGLSPMQLHQLFKRNFEITFSRFMNQCRVEEAKSLLLNHYFKENEIKELGFKAGFGSLAAFNHHFKRVTKMSPTEFRFFHQHFKKTTGMNLIEYLVEQN